MIKSLFALLFVAKDIEIRKKKLKYEIPLTSGALVYRMRGEMQQAQAVLSLHSATRDLEPIIDLGRMSEIEYF